MSRGPLVFKHVTLIKLATEQKELIARGALATGETVVAFMRRAAVEKATRELRKLKQAA